MPRAALPADIDAIQAIYAHHVAGGCATFELEAPSVEQMRRRYDALVQAGFPFLVAEAGSRVVGYAYAGPYRERPAYRHTVEDSIYLSPTAMGQGIGTRLLQALVDECKRIGLRQVVAVIGDSANAASIGLHRKAGFTLVGTLRAVGWKHGRWVDTVLMQRALGAADTRPPSP